MPTIVYWIALTTTFLTAEHQIAQNMMNWQLKVDTIYVSDYFAHLLYWINTLSSYGVICATLTFSIGIAASPIPSFLF